MKDEFTDIRIRYNLHYQRSLGEPVGLARMQWRDDTEWLIYEVERLRALVAKAPEAPYCEKHGVMVARDEIHGEWYCPGCDR
jgi:hypothetical protein